MQREKTQTSAVGTAWLKRERAAKDQTGEKGLGPLSSMDKLGYWVWLVWAKLEDMEQHKYRLLILLKQVKAPLLVEKKTDPLTAKCLKEPACEQLFFSIWEDCLCFRVVEGWVTAKKRTWLDGQRSPLWMGVSALASVTMYLPRTWARLSLQRKIITVLFWKRLLKNWSLSWRCGTGCLEDILVKSSLALRSLYPAEQHSSSHLLIPQHPALITLTSSLNYVCSLKIRERRAKASSLTKSSSPATASSAQTNPRPWGVRMQHSSAWSTVDTSHHPWLSLTLPFLPQSLFRLSPLRPCTSSCSSSPKKVSLSFQFLKLQCIFMSCPVFKHSLVPLPIKPSSLNLCRNYLRSLFSALELGILLK